MTQAAPGASGLPVASPAPVGIVPKGAAEQRFCLDCGIPLRGKFCFACGQKDEPLKRGLKDLTLEFFQHPLIDTKLWRSLVPLLLRPGALTEEYLAGRRTRYVRPLKLYLTVSVAFFALFALLVPKEHFVQIDVKPSASADVSQEKKEEVHFPIRWLDERFKRNSEALEGPGREAAAQSLATKIAGRIPKMVFALLPLSAVLFKLFWRKRYFVEHLVFTLHLHSFAFTAGMLRFFRWAPVTGVLVLWGAVYALLAFKRVYGDGWVKTLAKLTGVSLAYLVLFALAMALTAFTAFLLG